jgi:hypothetical protein
MKSLRGLSFDAVQRKNIATEIVPKKRAVIKKRRQSTHKGATRGKAGRYIFTNVKIRGIIMR